MSKDKHKLDPHAQSLLKGYMCFVEEAATFSTEPGDLPEWILLLMAGGLRRQTDPKYIDAASRRQFEAAEKMLNTIAVKEEESWPPSLAYWVADMSKRYKCRRNSRHPPVGYLEKADFLSLAAGELAIRNMLKRGKPILWSKPHLQIIGDLMVFSVEVAAQCKDEPFFADRYALLNPEIKRILNAKGEPNFDNNVELAINWCLSNSAREFFKYRAATTAERWFASFAT